MGVTDDLLRNNARYADGFDKRDLPGEPAKKVAVLACMDARMDIHKILGLSEGDAHVIRNAGGVASQDAIRSLLISQRLLGTEEIVLIHHTNCGMTTFDEGELKRQIEQEAGVAPDFPLGAFSDLEDNLRGSITSIRENPFIPNDRVRGFIYDVQTGRLREVDPPA